MKISILLLLLFSTLFSSQNIADTPLSEMCINLILHDKKRINLFANRSPLDIELKSSFISNEINKKIIIR